MSPSRKTRLTPRGIILVTAGTVLGISGFLIGSPELTAISLTLIIVPANSWVLEKLRTPVSRFDLSINPEYVTAHSTADVFLTVIGGDTLAWRISVKPPRALGKAVILHRGETNLQVTAHHRGVFTLGRVTAQRHDPLKLASTTMTGVSHKQVVVYPYVAPLKNETARLLSQRSSHRQQQYSLTNTSSDDATLRQYVAGDDLRRVHWTATARHGDLLVRSGEGSQKRVITLCIDNRQNPAHPARVERIISVAASGAVFLTDRGWKVNIQTITSSGRLRTYRALSATNVRNELAHIPTATTLTSGQTVRPEGNEIALLTFTDVDLPALTAQSSGAANTDSAIIGIAFSSKKHSKSGKRPIYVEDADTVDEAWNRIARVM